MVVGWTKEESGEECREGGGSVVRMKSVMRIQTGSGCRLDKGREWGRVS